MISKRSTTMCIPAMRLPRCNAQRDYEQSYRAPD
jgi:hypothetical protein